MNNVTYLFNEAAIVSLENLVKMLKDDEITHGICIYRTEDEDLKYFFLGAGEEYRTYYNGMLEVVKDDINYNCRQE